MIIRSCIRMAAVKALRNSTWAEERCYDSETTPLQEAVKAAAKPFAVVYTEDLDDTIEGRDQLCPDKRNMKLVVEFGLAGRIEAVDGGSPVAIPATSDAMERAVDLFEYQIVTQLFHRPDNPWGELLRRMVPAVHSVASTRAGESERGVRWAARQRVMVVETIADPTPGEVLKASNPIFDFLTMARADEDMSLAKIPELIESLLSTTDRPTWRQAQAALGLTEDEVRGIGIAPPYLTPDDEVTTDKIRINSTDQDHATADNIDERVNTIDIEFNDQIVTVPVQSENPL